MMIPRPVSITYRKESFLIHSETSVVSCAGAKLAAACLIETLFRAAGFRLASRIGSDSPSIQFLEEPSLSQEAYSLKVSPKQIQIRASGAAGHFYAVQSLLQLLPAEIHRTSPASNVAWSVPCVCIQDCPRFHWRGLMLDVARHMFSVAEIKRFIDHMALHKFNLLHLHLVDDQGWRLEIKQYPKLTEVGAWRSESPKPGDRNNGDNTPYGGFYTQAEMADIISYASDRFVSVLPEIEMPGHSGAAIAAYPELGNDDCPGFVPEVRTRWGINSCILSPKESTFTFLENVLTEVMEVFPFRYIHVGGDEAPKSQWEQSPFAQALIERENLGNTHALQSWFLRRMETFLQSHGRKLIGWDEIQEGGLSPDATMMVWRDVKWVQAALNAGNEVVMSPQSHCYLDHSQADPKTEPEAIRGTLTLKTAYSYEPVPPLLPEEKEKLVLGVQGNIWTEYIRDRDYLDYMTWPRACALAEVAWSPKMGKSFPDFFQRLQAHAKRLTTLGIRFRPLEQSSNHTSA